MGKLKCHCGAVISDSVYPSSTQGEIRTQEDAELYETQIEDAI